MLSIINIEQQLMLQRIIQQGHDIFLKTEINPSLLLCQMLIEL